MNKKPTPPTSIVLIILAFFAIYLIWGSTYLFNKILVSELPPFFLAGFRFVSASLLVGLYCLITMRKTLLTRSKLKNAIIAGFLFLTLGNGCLVYSLQFVDSGFAALLVAAVPLVVIVLMYFMRGAQISYMSMFGIFLGIVGVYLLTRQGSDSMLSGNWMGIAGILISMVAWSYASIYVGDKDLPEDSLINTGIQMFSGGLIMLIISFLTETHRQNPMNLGLDGFLAMAYLVVFGSIIAFTAFNYLLLHVSPEKVSTSNYINPIVAMVLGWIYLDESISTQSLLAALVLLTGVYFVNSSNGKG